MEVKKQILASQISVKRTLQNERAMERELSKFFKRLKGEVLSALKEYWSEYQLLQGQINLMVAPVHEAHKEYYEILEKYVKREYKLGQAEAKRNVERLQKKNRVALKATTTMPIKGFINHNKYDLFETSPRAERDLLDRTFRASEQTMNRVDNQINNIITEGYRSGKGINDISAQLSKRFDQLSSWESRRIARTEVNTSHNVATRDTYKDLGVEYTQWIAASDDRTRDSHLEVDGEIIPIDGKYSNGLGYPGDMSGPIEEWINCRCSNAPFVVPFGYMAPSFSPFRESDLIPINDEMGQEPTPEQLQTNLDSAQRALYDKYQNEIKDSKATLGSLFSTNRERIQAQHTIETTTIKLNQLKNIASGELGKGYATLWGRVAPNINPTHAEEIQWKGNNLSNLRTVDKNGRLGEFNRNEKFVKHHFKDVGLTIFESANAKQTKANEIYEAYKNLPKPMRKAREIVISEQDVVVPYNGRYARTNGYVVNEKGNNTIYQFKQTADQSKSTINHESSHMMEKDSGYHISNSQDWYEATHNDDLNLKFKGYAEEDRYPSRYAYEFTKKALSEEAHPSIKKRAYSEDFADSVDLYLRYPEAFKSKFPYRAKVIEKALDGGYDPKTTLSHAEYERQKWTKHELSDAEHDDWGRLMDKEEEGTLTSKERKKMQYYEDKYHFNKLYLDILENRDLTMEEIKEFQRLQKKHNF